MVPPWGRIPVLTLLHCRAAGIPCRTSLGPRLKTWTSPSPRVGSREPRPPCMLGLTRVLWRSDLRVKSVPLAYQCTAPPSVPTIQHVAVPVAPRSPTDLISTNNPPGDEGLEVHIHQHVNFNTGVYFVRATEGGCRYSAVLRLQRGKCQYALLSFFKARPTLRPWGTIARAGAPDVPLCPCGCETSELASCDSFSLLAGGKAWMTAWCSVRVMGSNENDQVG